MKCLAIINNDLEQCDNTAKKIGKIDTYCLIHYKQKILNGKKNLENQRRNSISNTTSNTIDGGDASERELFNKSYIDNINNILSNNFKKKYNIIKFVTKTMMSDIFVIKDLENGKEYILKIYVIMYDKKYNKQEHRYFNMMIDKIDNEYKFMNDLQHPQIITLKDQHSYETHTDKKCKYSYVITHKYHISLYDIFKKNKDRLSNQIIKYIGSQLVNVIRYIHNKGYLYLDFSLNNIMFFNEQDYKLVLIDLGMVESYLTSDGSIRAFYKGYATYGTPLYSSKNATIGNVADRLDDIESIFYILCHLYLLYLPWGKHLHDYSDAAINLTYKSKTTFHQTKHFSKLPDFLKNYHIELELYQYYQETPDYDKLINILS